METIDELVDLVYNANGMLQQQSTSYKSINTGNRQPGPIIARDPQYDTTPGERISQDDQFTYQYDAEGNLVQRTSKFQPIVIDDLESAVDATTTSWFSPQSGNIAAPNASNPQQRYSGDSSSVVVSVTFPEIGEGIYDVWSTWKESSTFGLGKYEIFVQDDFTRANTPPGGFGWRMLKDPETGLFRRTKDSANATEIPVDFKRSPGNTHDDNISWYNVGTVQLSADSILRLRLQNEAGQVVIDGFKLTPHIAKEITLYDHANRPIHAELYSERLSTASSEVDYFYDVGGKMVAVRNHSISSDHVTTTGFAYQGNQQLFSFDLDSDLASLSNNSGKISSFNLIGLGGEVLGFDGYEAGVPLLQKTTWQVNNLDGTKFTDTRTWTGRDYAFAGQKLASTNTDFLVQSRDLHRHTWATAPTFWEHFDSQFHTFNRVAGAVQVVSAVIELGEAAVALPACITLVGCSIPLAAGVHALDDAQAGIRSLVSGDAVETYAFQAIKAATGSEAAARASEIAIGVGVGSLDDLMKLSRTAGKAASAGAARHVARRVAFESGATLAGGAVGGIVTAGPGEGFNWDGALMGASLGQLSGAVAGHYLVACFAAGTPIVVDLEGNSRLIEELEVGDVVLARNEFDPTGPLELKRIEEKFVRTAGVLELVIRGRSIKTTAEHPFYVPSQGKFIAAGELKAGDELVGHSGQLVHIDSLSPLGEIATVYNFRVADHHTYFVGCDEWGFSVWAHNAACSIENVRDAIGKRGRLADGELRHAAGLLSNGEYLQARTYLARKGINIERQSVRQLIAEHSPYAETKNRPSYASGQVEQVWNNAASLDRKRRVFDPHTGEQLFWDRSASRYDQWHMGHRTDHEYSTLHKRFLRGKISLEVFFAQYRNPRNYYPESPAENLSHRHEAMP